jgi:predicted MFS family arabinose efflux permease
MLEARVAGGHMTVRSRRTWALVALALGGFAIGTAELVVVGVLPLVADGLRVSVSTAGLIVTAYAVGIIATATVVGVPLGMLLGRAAGGRVLATHGVRPVALTAALICAVAVPAAWATGMRARSTTVDGQPSGGPAVADTAGRAVPEGVAADD